MTGPQNPYPEPYPAPYSQPISQPYIQPYSQPIGSIPIPAPTIVHTYDSMNAFQNHQGEMARGGYVPTSISQATKPNGCLIVLLLVIGITIIPLLLIPFLGFTRTVTAIYTYSPAQAQIAAQQAMVAYEQKQQRRQTGLSTDTMTPLYVRVFGRDLTIGERWILAATVAVVLFTILIGSLVLVSLISRV